MALSSLHPKSDSAPASDDRPNEHGFTAAMREAIAKQYITEHQPFGGLSTGWDVQFFEQASAILLIMAKGHQARDETRKAAGESEFDLISSQISAQALEGVASLIHTGVLLNRVAES